MAQTTPYATGLAPGLLVASPTLGDPNFDGSVVLMAEHHAEGALGFVVNRPGPIAVADVLRGLDSGAGRRRHPQRPRRRPRDGGRAGAAGPALDPLPARRGPGRGGRPARRPRPGAGRLARAARVAGPHAGRRPVPAGARLRRLGAHAGGAGGEPGRLDPHGPPRGPGLRRAERGALGPGGPAHRAAAGRASWWPEAAPGPEARAWPAEFRRPRKAGAAPDGLLSRQVGRARLRP